MKIVVDHDSGYVPVGYILYPVDDNGEWYPRTHPNLLIESDWDYLLLASIYGYVPCTNGCTDGSVDCRCTGKTSTDMIAEAIEILNTNLGVIVESDIYAYQLREA